jgi:uncharacterized coiled-coil DUF342 family protein
MKENERDNLNFKHDELMLKYLEARAKAQSYEIQADRLTRQLREARQALKDISVSYQGMAASLKADNALKRIDDDYTNHGQGD